MASARTQKQTDKVNIDLHADYTNYFVIAYGTFDAPELARLISIDYTENCVQG